MWQLESGCTRPSLNVHFHKSIIPCSRKGARIGHDDIPSIKKFTGEKRHFPHENCVATDAGGEPDGELDHWAVPVPCLSL